jgi:moderate conductance mechanosensitive channel
MKTIIVLIVGIGIFAFLKVIKIILGRRIHKYSLWSHLYKLYPVIGSIIWIVFVFWLAGYLFKDRLFYPYAMVVMVLVIVGFITWFLLRDVFAGVLFKVENDLNPGDHIKIGSISGKIKSLHLTNLEIISDDGHTIKIPNARLNKELISDMSSPEGMEEFNIHLTIDKRFTKPEIEEKIKYDVALSPWSHFKTPPDIKYCKEDEHTFTYDVLVYTLNHKHFRIIEKTLKNKFEN